ncbi:hypothetical protein B0H13DRAFT_2329871 [Mycena leptocephala]|nr:hypothetical protein B0H13DRAFT_2329868 [Mycena leptocephala]KAJ7909927.1 hypothetical protein B0H13DRAFT_2329871 [Mycena leptocephala]
MSMDPSSFSHASVPAVVTPHPNAPLPSEDVEMTDLSEQARRDSASYPAPPAEQRFLQSMGNAHPHRPLLPAIDTDLPLRSFEASQSSAPYHTPSTLFHSTTGARPGPLGNSPTCYHTLQPLHHRPTSFDGIIYISPFPGLLDFVSQSITRGICSSFAILSPNWVIISPFGCYASSILFRVFSKFVPQPIHPSLAFLSAKRPITSPVG